MEPFHGKKYKLVSSDNFDNYMKALGVGLLTRKVGNSVSPVIDIAKSDDGEYVLTSVSTFKTVVTKFKPGEEFEETTPDGRKVKAIFTIDGNRLLEVQDKGTSKETTVERIFKTDEVEINMKIGDVTSKRIYKLLE